MVCDVEVRLSALAQKVMVRGVMLPVMPVVVHFM